MRVCDRCGEKKAFEVLVPRTHVREGFHVHPDVQSSLWSVDLCQACMTKLDTLLTSQRTVLGEFAGLTEKWKKNR